MEKRIEQDERVASLGRVAATMAHEFNNVLMSILPFAEVVAREGKDSPKLALSSHHIINAVRRGREITSEVLRFANPVAPSLRPLDLRHWLPDLKNELTEVLSSKYVIDIQIPATPLTILGDPNQLGQVFVNLAINARDAMPSGGTLVIRASADEDDDEYATRHVPDVSRFAHILVIDHGQGVGPENLGRIFEPLFTTKLTGTGIGLGDVQQTVARHGGEILVESELGAGTTFHLFLPLAECTAPPDTPDVPQVTDRSLAHKRILLVEDEPSVAAGITDYLEAHGATVRVVGESRDVLRIIRDFSPHTVILDVMLPDADGRVVQKEIARAFPSLPVLMSSGAIDAGNEAGASAFLAFLQKPYSSEELSTALCNLIGAS
jgi:CheY-like chemotaxis protein